MSLKRSRNVIIKPNKLSASLTVEASFVMPIFIYLILVFLYFFQILQIQEHIQDTITKMGLDMAQYAYVNQYFNEDVNKSSESADINHMDIIHEFKNMILDEALLKWKSAEYMKTKKLENSIIIGGFNGLDFSQSSGLNDDNYIKIIVRYQVKLPVRVFTINIIAMTQGIKLRSWTGHTVSPLYSIEEDVDGEGEAEDEKVYITQTGTVYHNNRNCTYLKLSIKVVHGIPHELRNDNGAKYYPCEICLREDTGKYHSTYYITTDGTRYHHNMNCSSLKRTVIEMKKSEVSDRKLCKRCDN